MRFPSARPLMSVAALTAAALVLAAGTAAADPGPVPGPVRALTAPLLANPDCTLHVPADPLSPQGLATPYVLHSAGQQCSEANQNLAAFVQATIFDPRTGRVWVYNPVVRDAGQPLLGTRPPRPRFPEDAVVAIWTGFNGNVLKLTGPGAKFFVNFAQQSYAGSPQMFAALNHAVRDNHLTVPALGTASDGQTCPSTRDFSIVDQDQSDNVPVSYAAYNVSNGSDEQLVDVVSAALGCTVLTFPSLSSPGSSGPDGIMQELQASLYQQAPVALVPGNDEFVTDNGQFVAPNGTGKPDLVLQNLYRLQVGQPLTKDGNDTLAYCQNLASVGEPRLKADAATEAGFPAPVFAPIGTNLANVLAGRFAATWGMLNCPGLTGNPSPITPILNAEGLVSSAIYA